MINKQIRELWAEKTFELTNIGAGVLIFSQLVSEKGLRAKPTITGLVTIFIGYFISYRLLKKRR